SPAARPRIPQRPVRRARDRRPWLPAERRTSLCLHGWPGWGGPPEVRRGRTPPSLYRQHHEVAVGAVEAFAAAVDAHHDVLDARAVAARQVDAGLHRERHARLERPVRPGHDVRLLVHLEADAVSGAVDEVLAVAGLRDEV